MKIEQPDGTVVEVKAARGDAALVPPPPPLLIQQQEREQEDAESRKRLGRRETALHQVALHAQRHRRLIAAFAGTMVARCLEEALDAVESALAESKGLAGSKDWRPKASVVSAQLEVDGFAQIKPRKRKGYEDALTAEEMGNLKVLRLGDQRSRCQTDAGAVVIVATADLEPAAVDL